MLVLPAYAKLNLSLSVVARRPDGWHDIDSLLVPIDWHDLVGIRLRSAPVTRVTLRLCGSACEGVPLGEHNLAARAGRALAELSTEPLDVQIWLCKVVPHAAGLGGGSADAAATLRGGLRLLAERGVTAGADALAAAGFALGSDVPALLAGGAQRVTGRGERLSATHIPALHLAVASTLPSSTPATYAALLPAELDDDRRPERLAALLASGAAAPDSLLGSALEPAACRADPALAGALHRARAAVPDATWHLTGSGGAIFAVAPDDAAADGLALRMSAAGFAARACRSIP